MSYRINREEAIKQAGKETVEAAERAHAVPTGRVTDGTPDQGMTEFSANASNVTMYVYFDNADAKSVEEYSDLDWDSAITDTAEYEIS